MRGLKSKQIRRLGRSALNLQSDSKNVLTVETKYNTNRVGMVRLDPGCLRAITKEFKKILVTK